MGVCALLAGADKLLFWSIQKPLLVCSPAHVLEFPDGLSEKSNRDYSLGRAENFA